VARDIFGAPNVQIEAPGWLRGNVSLLGLSLPYNRLFIVALTIACVAAVWYFTNRMAAGRRMRAVVQNRQLASCAGIATERVDQLAFFIGSGLAGVAGVALTLIGPVGPTLGSYYIVDAFLVVVVGGLGHLWGAALAALALGVLSSFGEFWTDASLAKVLVFVCIIAFLQLRPQGLFVVRSRALT
jgi:urea transport system permease protein